MGELRRRYMENSMKNRAGKKITYTYIVNENIVSFRYIGIFLLQKYQIDGKASYI